MNKKLLILIIAGLVIAASVLLIFNHYSEEIKNSKMLNLEYATLTNNSSLIAYNDFLKVTERLTKDKVKVILNDKEKHEFILYSSNLKIGDELKISYSINQNTMKINGIENYNITTDDQEMIRGKMSSDLEKYWDRIQGYINESTGDYALITPTFIPIKLDNQYYITVSTIDYILTGDSICEPELRYWKPDDKPHIEIDDSFKIISFINIPYAEGYDIKNSINVKFNIENKKIYFEHNEFGIYELVIEFDNGNIIKLLFR